MRKVLIAAFCLGPLAAWSVDAPGQEPGQHVIGRDETPAPGPDPVKEGMIDVGWRSLHYRLYGSGAPAVVLVSGFAAPQSYWGPVVAGIAARTTVLTYDRAGYGKSGLGDRSVDGKATIEDLHRLLEGAGLPGPYILVGHSYGGGIVRLFASAYPEEMAGLILEDAQHEGIYEAHRSLMKGEDLETFNRMESMRPPGLPEGPARETDARAATREQLRESGPLPRIPYTVITAGKRPPWSSMFSQETAAKMAEAGVEYQRKLAELIPGGRQILVEDAGHNLHQERPEVVTGAVLEMVDAVRGRSTVEALLRGTLRRLTTDPAADIEPKWSPDGKTLSFASDRTEDWNVWTIGRDGSALTQVTSGLQYVHSTWWSPDGTRLALAAAEKSDNGGFIGYVYTMPLGGGEMTRLTDGPIDGSPCWSPDGRSIAFASMKSGNWDLWVIPAEGGGAVPVAAHEGFDHSPRWSPDGTKLAFHSDRSGNGDIWIVEVFGGEPSRLTSSDAFDHFPAWSPDGKYVAFHSDRAGDFDIWAIPAEGGEPIQLTSGPHNDMRPAWSPDGRSLAFTSNRGGNDDIWLLEAM